MATPTPQDQAEINKLYNEYISLLQQVNNLSYIDAQQKADAAKATNTLSIEIDRVKRDMNDIVFQSDYLYRSFQETTAELKNQNNLLKIGKSLFSQLTDVAQKLTNFQKGYTDLREKDLKKLQSSFKIQREENDKIVADLGEINRLQKRETQIKNLEDQARIQGFLTVLQTKRLNELKKEQALYDAALDAQQSGIPILEKELSLTKSIGKARQDIGGLAGAGAEILSKFGGSLAQYLDISDASEAVSEFNKKVIDDALKQQNVLASLNQIEQQKLQLEQDILDKQTESTQELIKINKLQADIATIGKLRNDQQSLSNSLNAQTIADLETRKNLVQSILQSTTLDQAAQDNINNKLTEQIDLQQRFDDILLSRREITQELNDIVQLLANSQNLSAQEINDLTARRNDLLTEQNNLSTEQTTITGNLATIQNDVNALLGQTGALHSEINNKLNEEITLTNDLAQAKINQANALAVVQQKTATLSADQNKLEEDAYKIKEAAIKGASTGLTGFINKFKSLGVLVNNLNFTKVFTDPTVLLTTLISLGFKANSQVVELGKSFGVSAKAAENMRQDMAQFARGTGDTFINTDRLLKAQSELSKELGIAVRFSNEELATFAKLTELTGLTAQEAGKLALASKAAGIPTEDYTDSIREAAFYAQQATGTHFDSKEILQDVSKLSAGILVKFQGNPKALGEAVVQAKKLGLTLDQVDKVGESLLNWEQSIENELKAELLTGRELNMERARAAALSGDQLTLTREISDQVGSLEDYQNMNVLAQRSLAEAFGLSRDEMSEMLMKQEAINKYGSEAAKLNKEQLEDMERQGLSASEYLKKQEQQQAAQDKFKDAIVKLQDIIGNLVAGPVGQLLDALANMVGFVMKIFGNPVVKFFLDIIAKTAELLSDIASSGFGQWAMGLTAVALLLPKISSGLAGIGGSILNVGKSILNIGRSAISGVTSLFGGNKPPVPGPAPTPPAVPPASPAGNISNNVNQGAQNTMQNANNMKPSDDGTNIRKKLQNIAKGIKSFANTKVLLGALNLIPSALGLTAMIPGAVGAKMISNVDGDSFEKAMKGIAKGIKYLGDKNLFAGVGNLVVASAGLTAMIPGAIGAKLISLVDGDAFQKAMKGIAKGITYLGDKNVFAGVGNLIVASVGLTAMIPGAVGAKLISLIDGDAFQKTMKGIAKGIEAFGNKNLTFGSLNLIAASIGLTAMIPGAIGAKMISLIDGDAFQKTMKGIAKGIEAFGNRNLLFGSLNLIVASLGLTAMIPGAIGAKMISLVDGKAFQKTMTGLANGIESFGTGKVLLGAGAMIVAAVGLTAMIPGIVGAKLISLINGEKFKESMYGIAYGIESFASTKVLAGSAVMLLAGLGLTDMIPGVLAAKLISLVDGEKFKKSMVGIAKGIEGFFDKVSYGTIIKAAAAIALLGASLTPAAYAINMFGDVEWESITKAGVVLGGLAAIGYVLGKASESMLKGALAIGVLGVSLIPAAIALKMFADISWEDMAKAGVALVGLGVAGAAFGSFLPLMLMGAVGIAALGTALIPFALALNIMAPAIEKFIPLVEAFGNVVTKVFGGIATVVTASANGIATIFGSLQDIDVVKLLAIGPALMGVGAGLAALGAGNVIDAIGSFFAGDPAEKIAAIAASGEGLQQTSTALQTTSAAIAQLNASLASLDVSKLDAIGPAITKIGIGLASLGVGNAIDSISSLFAGDPIEKLERLAATSDGLQTASSALQSIAIALMGVSAALTTIDVSKLESLSEFEPNKSSKSIFGSITDLFSSPAEKTNETGFAPTPVSTPIPTPIKTTNETINNTVIEGGKEKGIEAPTINAGGIDLTPMVNAINEVKAAVTNLQNRPVKLYMDSREITARQLQANNSI